MVRSENFNNLMSMIVGADKGGVILFMRSQGIDMNVNAEPQDVVKVLYPALTSDVFRANFIVGMLARILVLSVTAPSSMGTFISTRITRF